MKPTTHCLELLAAEQSLPPCTCGSKLLVRYDPGVSKIGCIRCGVVKHGPEWCVTELAEEIRGEMGW